MGERYILGNRNYTLDRLFADLGRVSGIEPPALKVPYPVAFALAQAAERLPGRPPVTTIEVRASSQWWTYRNTKAKRELGFKPSPARGDHQRHGRVVPRARGRPLLACGHRTAVPAQDRRLGGQARRRPRGPDGSLRRLAKLRGS